MPRTSPGVRPPWSISVTVDPASADPVIVGVSVSVAEPSCARPVSEPASSFGASGIDGAVVSMLNVRVTLALCPAAEAIVTATRYSPSAATASGGTSTVHWPGVVTVPVMMGPGMPGTCPIWTAIMESIGALVSPVIVKLPKALIAASDVAPISSAPSTASMPAVTPRLAS